MSTGPWLVRVRRLQLRLSIWGNGCMHQSLLRTDSIYSDYFVWFFLLMAKWCTRQLKYLSRVLLQGLIGLSKASLDLWETNLTVIMDRFIQYSSAMPKYTCWTHINFLRTLHRWRWQLRCARTWHLRPLYCDNSISRWGKAYIYILRQ